MYCMQNVDTFPILHQLGGDFQSWESSNVLHVERWYISHPSLISWRFPVLRVSWRLLRVKEIEYTEAIDQEEEKIAEVKREYAPQQNLLEQQRKEIQSSEQVLEKDKVSSR